MTVTSVQDTDMGRCLVDIRGDCYLQDRHGPRAWWTSGLTVTYRIHMGRCLVDISGDCYLQDRHGPRAWWTSGVTVTYRIDMGRALGGHQG